MWQCAKFSAAATAAATMYNMTDRAFSSRYRVVFVGFEFAAAAVALLLLRHHHLFWGASMTFG